jgi:hypothetical protein
MSYRVGDKHYKNVLAQQLVVNTMIATSTDVPSSFGSITLTGSGPSVLEVSGGITASDIDISGEVSTTDLVVNSTATIAGVLTVLDTTPSTNCTTGALVVAGGVGICGDLNIDGDLTVNGSMPPVDSIRSATTIIDVASATAPTTGQVLTATDGVSATWVTPTAGTGDTVAPATNTSGYIPTWTGTDSKTLTDGLNPTSLATLIEVETFFSKTITSTTNNVNSKGLHSASTVVDVATAVAPTAGQVLTASSGTAATWVTPTAGTGDTVAPATNTTGYIPTWNGTDSKTLADGLNPGTLVTLTGTETLINKTLTSAATNDIAANSLHSASTVVDVATAVAPTAGQVLTASSGTAAAWVTPTIGDTLAPATNTTGYIPTWNGTDSKTLADGLDPTTLVTLTGTENLTRKTLITPTIKIINGQHEYTGQQSLTYAGETMDYGLTTIISDDGLWLGASSTDSRYLFYVYNRATTAATFTLFQTIALTPQVYPHYVDCASFSSDGQQLLFSFAGLYPSEYYQNGGASYTKIFTDAGGINNTGSVDCSKDGLVGFSLNEYAATHVLRAHTRVGATWTLSQTINGSGTGSAQNVKQGISSSSNGDYVIWRSGSDQVRIMYNGGTPGSWATQINIAAGEATTVSMSDAGDRVVITDPDVDMITYERIGVTWTLGYTFTGFITKNAEINPSGTQLSFITSDNTLYTSNRLDANAWSVPYDAGSESFPGVPFSYAQSSGRRSMGMTDQFIVSSEQGAVSIKVVEIIPRTVSINGTLLNSGLTYPVSDGTANQIIETDGAGTLTFVTPQVTLTGTETLTNKTLTIPVIDSISPNTTVPGSLFQTLDTTTWASGDFGCETISGDGLWLIGASNTTSQIVAFTRATTSSPFVFSSIIGTGDLGRIHFTLSPDGVWLAFRNGSFINIYKRTGTSWVLNSVQTPIGSTFTMTNDGLSIFEESGTIVRLLNRVGDVWTDQGIVFSTTNIIQNSIDTPGILPDSSGDRIGICLTTSGGNQGAWIYKNGGGLTWGVEQRLTTVLPLTHAINAAGDFYVVYDSTNGVQYFTRSGVTWSAGTVITPPVYSPVVASFGTRIRMSKDGTVLIIYDNATVNGKIGRITIYKNLVFINTVDDISNLAFTRDLSPNPDETALTIMDDGSQFAFSTQADPSSLYIYNSVSSKLNITGKVTISGALTASGLTYPSADGSVGQLLNTDGAGNLSFVTPQVTLTGTETLTNKTLTTPILTSYAVASLPVVGTAGGIIYVSDATGSGVTGSMCFSNGVAWIDVTTGIGVV